MAISKSISRRLKIVKSTRVVEGDTLNVWGAILIFALDLLNFYTNGELSQARQRNNKAKQARLIKTRSRLIVGRVEMHSPQVSAAAR